MRFVEQTKDLATDLNILFTDDISQLTIDSNAT